ncbi:MAG: proline--tRNA ligase [Kiritimatiellae bacterium]|jgi:prolyl-tRNA synthetase|nr:proline--tRNA ligase [Kiritimatiellia bacterium]
MRWSRTLLNTLRDNPQDAEINSHKLLIRAGLARKLAGGLYTFMPLGLRTLHKISAIVRDEMNKAEAQEILMPALQPSELWERSGRLETMGPGMFKLKDRAERLMALGPTHEEVVTELLSNEINSYRQLPCTVYQIQTKFRDEIRPRFGLMRAKEFIMKDAYSFDASMDDADKSYKAMYNAYVRIFNRCGLDARPVEADTGDIGGQWSHEFMVLADSGEDGIVDCAACGYAANQEKAERIIPEKEAQLCPAIEEIETPGIKTIDQLVSFLKCKSSAFIKTLIYLADDQPVVIIIPGNRALNEHKLKRVLQAKKLEMADDATILSVTGATAGFAGPVGLSVKIFADNSLKNATNLITGANKADSHIKNVDIERDTDVTAYEDLVIVTAGDCCPRCRERMQIKRGIEVGHVFKLGTKYTEAFEAKYLNDKGESLEMVMGCYGIGVTRTLQAVIEQSNDKDGIIWPISVAPFAITILNLDPSDDQVNNVVDGLEKELTDHNLDVFIDDRNERPGVKFKDADLIGCPLRVVVGARGLKNNSIEIKQRSSKKNTQVPVEEAAKSIIQLAEEMFQRCNS